MLIQRRGNGPAVKQKERPQIYTPKISLRSLTEKAAAILSNMGRLRGAKRSELDVNEGNEEITPTV
jgi:hypothetical protein